MKISILTIFPELYDAFLKTSIIARAQEKGLLQFNIIRFSDLCEPKVRIDEPTVGPGVGMILTPSVVESAIEIAEAKWGKGYKIFFSPRGTPLKQSTLKTVYSKIEPNNNDSMHLILICCRYEGLDERVLETYADKVISIGDYVLMGGDLPAQVLLEGLLRLLPGVVGKKESVEKESFEGPFLDYPQYGLPVEWNKQVIPEVLRSGNHAIIEQWRKEKSIKKTVLERFDWLRKNKLSKNDKDLVRSFIPKHYVALMHNDVILKAFNKVGNTSITSIDIHDISRSSATYGIENVFLVSALKDQHAILEKFLDFWMSSEGKKYNTTRFEAIKKVVPAFDFDQVVEVIYNKEGKKPIIIATSAKIQSEVKSLDYYSQEVIWKQDRPVLFVFGTGQGLSSEFLQKCDYLFGPINGLIDYNHLSVRSAVSIVLDRWLGLNPDFDIVKSFDILE